MKAKPTTTDTALFFTTGMFVGLLFWVFAGWLFATIFNYAIAESFNTPQLDTSHAMGIIILAQLLKWEFPRRNKTPTVNNIVLPEMFGKDKSNARKPTNDSTGNA